MTTGADETVSSCMYAVYVCVCMCVCLFDTQDLAFWIPGGIITHVWELQPDTPRWASPFRAMLSSMSLKVQKEMYRHLSIQKENNDKRKQQTIYRDTVQTNSLHVILCVIVFMLS